MGHCKSAECLGKGAAVKDTVRVRVITSMGKITASGNNHFSQALPHNLSQPTDFV